MAEPSPTAEFLDSVAAAVRDALAALDQNGPAHDDVLTPSGNRQQTYAGALGQLEENLSGWQAILGDMAERVRVAQDELGTLDADLRRSLDAFAAARKHLQGA